MMMTFDRVEVATEQRLEGREGAVLIMYSETFLIFTVFFCWNEYSIEMV